MLYGDKAAIGAIIIYFGGWGMVNKEITDKIKFSNNLKICYACLFFCVFATYKVQISEISKEQFLVKIWLQFPGPSMVLRIQIIIVDTH